MTVDGSTIHGFEFADEDAMEREASYVRPDGYSLRDGNRMMCIGWIGPPHFYKAGRIIVIYVGDDD